MINFDDNTVYVLDSYGLIFRCYFAFISKPLTNAKGENISALFGFFRNIHYILEHYKPKYLVCAMDSKTPTFRHEMYPEYKATRNKTPDDLHAQIPWICNVLDKLGISILQCDGYEADDIIATVAKKCSETGRQCRILSGDKDLMQLVTDNTQILKPEAGSTWKINGIDGVEAEWGVKPSQLLDLLSLYGDTADNIPGVHGVGAKTAAKLLNDYETLDGIYSHIDEIKGAMQKKLIEGKENAYFSQKLVRLFDEVPCDCIDEAINKSLNIDYESGAKALLEHGALQVAKQYASMSGKDFKIEKTTENSENQNEIKINKGNYKAITEINELTHFIDNALQNKTVAFDCETDSLDTFKCNIAGFSLSIKKGEAVYIPLSDEQSLFDFDKITKADASCELKRIFENQDMLVIMHNGKFDLKVLTNNNMIDISNLRCSVFDTMVAYWLYNPERPGKLPYSLESLGESELQLKGIEFKDIVNKGETFKDVPLDKAVSYASEDADFTYQLYMKFKGDIYTSKCSKNKDFETLVNLEMKLLPILTKMELNGIHLDGKKLNEYDKELALGIKQAEKEIYSLVGHEFNISSPKQLQTVLFEELHLPTGKKTKTGYSTDTSVLEELAFINPVPKKILEYREMTKLQSTYVQTLPTLVDDKNRIHTEFVQTGTATGRLSCREPNLQNIPVRNEAGRRIRSAFSAPEGKVLISADYAQIELVVLSHLSEDSNMRNAFIEGVDVHKATAAMIYGVSKDDVTPEMRRTAKTINFGVIYGMSAFRLSKDLGIGRTEAQTFIENYFKTYSKIDDFMTNTVIGAEKNGTVKTIFGRERPIANINSKNKVEKAAAERIAVNTPVQGSAADIVKKAMLDVYDGLEELNNGSRLLLQVHDELILECPDDEKEIQRTVEMVRDKMENAVKLSVPLRVSIEYGKSWGEFH